jgi:hypothetical protein
MKLHRSAVTAGALLWLAAFAACYQGKDDVPRVSSFSTGSGGGAVSTTSGSGGSSGPTGSTGPGATTGTTGSGGAVDPCATAIFCDDFESYPTGSPPGGKWGNNMNGGAVSIDGTHVRSGSKAVKISADAASGYRSVMISLSDPSLLPAAGGVVYGRMMFWLADAPTDTVHWTFIDGYGAVPGQSYHAVYRYGGQVPLMSGATFLGSQLMANYDTPDSYGSPPTGPSSDCWLHANTEVVPVAKWTCAEWMFDTTHNTMRFWQDGAELTDLAMTGTGQGCVNQPATFSWLAPTVEQVDVGWESYQADGARTMWIDDVGIGAQRLGCPP